MNILKYLLANRQLVSRGFAACAKAAMRACSQARNKMVVEFVTCSGAWLLERGGTASKRPRRMEGVTRPPYAYGWTDGWMDGGMDEWISEWAGLNLGPYIKELMLVFLPCSEGFSPGSLVLLPPQKPTVLFSSSIRGARAIGMSVTGRLSAILIKQRIQIFLIYLYMCIKLTTFVPMHLRRAGKTSWQPPLSNNNSSAFFSISSNRAGEIPSRSSFCLCCESFLL